MTYLDFWNSIPMEWKNYFCNTLDVLAEKQGRTKYIVKDSEDNFFTIEVEVDNSFNGKNFVEAVKFSYTDYDGVLEGDTAVADDGTSTPPSKSNDVTNPWYKRLDYVQSIDHSVLDNSELGPNTKKMQEPDYTPYKSFL